MTDEKHQSGLTYRDAGVDIEAGNELVERIKPFMKATRRIGVDADIGGFGGLFDLKACGFKDPILVAASDGVGTKLRIAIKSGLHRTIGIDLVAVSVNNLVVQGAEPLFFLDYFATGKLDVNIAADVIAGIVEGCRRAGCALIGGETAEMPGLYAGEDYDLAGFAVGAVERGDLLPRRTVKPGDAVLGLAASGLHSTGYSLVRKVVERAGLSYHDPAPFSQDATLGEALLAPTRIYVKPVIAAQRQTGAIKALAHITGGGFIDNIPRLLSQGIGAEIDLSAIPLPPVFPWLAKSAGLEAQEMLRTFNCGIGMIVIVDPSDISRVTGVLAREGETVTPLGRLVESGEGPRILLTGALAG